MTMAGEPCFGCKGTWATRPPRLHRCALPHHQETLAPCDWKARQEVCAYSKYQLCFLEKCLLRSEFIFFLLHKCCLVVVNTKNTNLTVQLQLNTEELSGSDPYPVVRVLTCKQGLGHLWKASFQCLLFLIVAKYFEQSCLKGHLC